jgi:acid phosphatase type 7
MKRFALLALCVLSMAPCAFAITITRGPYFQLMRPGTVYIRYSTDVACDTLIKYKKSGSTTELTKSDSSQVTDHQIQLTGMSTYVKYIYSVNTSSQTLASGSGYFLWTSPDDDHPGVRMRFWALGDAGTGDANAQAVRDAYVDYMGSNLTGAIFLLGNNALPDGKYGSYDKKMFQIYKNQLRNAPVFPTLGEADTNGSTNPASNLPYFVLFTLPKGTEGGGQPTGTEKYYSINYGIIHFVVLDSQADNRSSTGPMLTWLKNDLSKNILPWVIAVFHHAPYSKGNHDSDSETAMKEMRQNALPILEDHGVDLVISAHSNSYERSFFLNGHYGTSDTLQPSMILNDGDGRRGSQGGDGAYRKHVNTNNSGTVYAVVGSSGQVVSGPLNHPAMYTGLARLGSMEFEVNNNILDAYFIQSDGVVGDFFEIVKDNTPGQVHMTAPANGSTFTRPTTITLTADATDPDTRIHRVMFFINGVQLNKNRDFVKPYTFDWTPTKAGTYTILAKSLDELGALLTSSSIQVTIK